MNGWCEYKHDGFDTDGTEWFRCVTHDELAPSKDAPCDGYIEIPYLDAEQRRARPDEWPALMAARALRLCAYHADGLGWDACSEGFEGCEVETARKTPGILARPDDPAMPYARGDW